MIAMMSKSFSEGYHPHKNISIDEGMVKFKGCLGFIQYMVLKPVKCGVKVWMTAASETGYVHAFDVYTGKNADGIREKNLGKSVVLNLTRVWCST